MKKIIKTSWDLSVLYKSVDDPKLVGDIQNAEKAYSLFAKKYQSSKKYITNESALLKALIEYEKLLRRGIYKPYLYLNYLQDLDSKDDKARAKFNLVSQELNKISNKILFFDLNLSKIDKKFQQKLLVSKKFAHFSYFLKNIFDASKFMLSEPEEKILSLKHITSSRMWVESTEKILNKMTVLHKGKVIPLSEAGSLIHQLPTQDERKTLHKKLMAEIAKASDVAESEINAIVTDKKIEDELRGYKEAVDETILRYQNDKKSVLNLIQSVTDSFKVSQRFFKVKAKMMKKDHLYYSDRGAGVGKTNKKISFSESYETLQTIFSSVHPEFRNILDRMVLSGQVDVNPKVGKRSGAYCNHYTNTPTMVLLNHTDDFKSLMTFAHEMGHAIHSELSKTLSPLYTNYSMSTAEVASTLFELFTFYHQLEKMTEKEKIIALHDKIHDDVQTIFRQIACFNFEIELHNTIRKNGNMSKEEISMLMNKHMSSYLGPIFKLEEEDGLFFVSWPHIRSFFYVYSYAFGQLTSKALYKKYSEDKSYIEKIISFLSLGGRVSPEDIFKSIGVDLKNPDFFKKGIESINEDISLLEQLMNKR